MTWAIIFFPVSCGELVYSYSTTVSVILVTLMKLLQLAMSTFQLLSWSTVGRLIENKEVGYRERAYMKNPSWLG